MLHIDIIGIGKVKQASLIDLCYEYVKRLTGICKVNFIEIPNCKNGDILKDEGLNLLKRIDINSFKVAMCIEGNHMSSVEFSKKIEDIQNLGFSKISFIIGGAYGLSEDVKNKADFKLSLSKMTLPHKLTRLVLIEQIYRAYMILKGTAYHK